ncbi:SWIB complex BAF60b domain-containing protein [Actinidia rufa]|uniref:SWIB complex BAF60b domain-containing protein n=1 Tax=Actinidia rufa TaxID=165716 RepID=A0A7J0GIM8_9ERIC|nr:SWIB complex BAF60b domain-containing protein [Actinidia rufa]
MASDQEIAKGVETVLRQSDPNAVTTLNGVVQQVEAELGLDLSHKASFIRDQINLLLRSHPLPPPPPPNPPKDHFSLQHHTQYPQFHPHFALQPQHPHHLYGNPPPPPQQPQPPPPQQSPVGQNGKRMLRMRRLKPLQSRKKAKFGCFALKVEGSAPAGSKRRGGPGGLNKVCGVSPELQAVVGEPALPRTEIVKQLWAYIRKNNLQDPSNKRKIICDDALRVVFETDCTDMFKMNKLLAKHIIPLGPTKESGQAKRLKVDVETATESSEPGSQPIIISEALVEFFGTGEREMIQSEAFRRVWEYIKVNRLEDPLSSMAILCDSKLQKLFGCESISALGISEMLSRHHLFKR